MLLFYRIITHIVYFLSPLILIFRLINKKDTLKSFFEELKDFIMRYQLNTESYTSLGARGLDPDSEYSVLSPFQLTAPTAIVYRLLA